MVRLLWSMASTLMIKYVENMQEQSLIGQRVIKAHMLSNGYLPHNVHITRNTIRSVNNYCFVQNCFKRKKKEQLKITGKNEKLSYLNEERTQINHKNLFAEVIKDCNLEPDNYALKQNEKKIQNF